MGYFGTLIFIIIALRTESFCILFSSGTGLNEQGNMGLERSDGELKGREFHSDNVERSHPGNQSINENGDSVLPRLDTA